MVIPEDDERGKVSGIELEGVPKGVGRGVNSSEAVSGVSQLLATERRRRTSPILWHIKRMCAGNLTQARAIREEGATIEKML